MQRPFPAYAGSDPFVFVCYSHDDAAVVYPELIDLRTGGFNIWYDEGIAPGSEWPEALARSIETCAVFLFFVTPRSVASEHCRREVIFAQDQRCRTLVVHLEPTVVPAALKLSLSHRQAINRFEHAADAYATKLNQALIETMEGDREPDIERQRPQDPEARSRVTPKLAVLPFADLSHDDESDYFSAGMSREVWNLLTRLDGLAVISMTSSSVYKNSALDARAIGARLTADYIVEGSVNRRGAQARVSVHLVETRGGTEVWGETYDRDLEAMDAIFALYEEIATAVQHALPSSLRGQAASLLHAPPTEHVAAYNLLQQAWYRVLESGDPRDSVPLIERALAMDPDYAEVHAVTAENLALFAEFGYGPSKQFFTAARESAERALALDPTLPIPHLIRGFLHDRLDLDFRAALEACREADRLGAPPEARMNWTQDTLLNAGLYEEGLALSRDAEEVSPGLAFPKIVTARFLARLGHRDAARAKFDDALTIAPGNAMVLSQSLLHFLETDPDIDRARAIVDGAGNASGLPDWGRPWVALAEGDPEPFTALVADWVAHRAEHHVRSAVIERAYFLLGDYAQHFHWYTVQVEERDALGWSMDFLRQRPDYWTRLREWALVEPGATRERLELIDQHRTLMDRITEKMVV